AVGVMVVIAFGLTNLGLLIAWRIESTQGFHAIMNLLLIPIWLLSGAFFPPAGVPAPLAWLMRLDPLTYGLAALRACLDPAAMGLPPFMLSLGGAMAALARPPARHALGQPAASSSRRLRPEAVSRLARRPSKVISG